MKSDAIAIFEILRLFVIKQVYNYQGLSIHMEDNQVMCKDRTLEFERKLSQ